jgi:hypothetical protein
MTTRNLSRRVDQLESVLAPPITEARTIEVDFMEGGEVVDTLRFEIPAVPLNLKKGSRWNQRRIATDMWP